MIAIVDYGVGNLHSVQKALEKTGALALVTSDAGCIARADKVILPGVGSFGHCMRNLAAYGLAEPIKKYAAAGRPFLGICVGMQILFEESEESPGVAGLGLLPGRVGRLPDNGFKIPQTGWNSLDIHKKERLFDNISSGEYVYFVHSYHAQPSDGAIVCASVRYGAAITAAIACGNIWATQFHPEKSGDVGLKILKNFGEMR